MTMNEVLARECRSAHALIGRLEWYIKNLPPIEMSTPDRTERTETDQKHTSTPSEQENKAVTRKTVGESVEARICASAEPHKQVQGDLFSFVAVKSQETKTILTPAAAAPSRPKKPQHERGTPSIPRRTALDNFRSIIGTREIVDLQDVNRVFGYNRSTSGTFIRDAVKRGDLATIRYGAHVKFLARDVKNFIRAWYDEKERKTISGSEARG